MSALKLKQIVDDMCSCTTGTGIEQITDSNGNTTSKSCYYVNVTLKTFQNMITEYGFSSDEIASSIFTKAMTELIGINEMDLFIFAETSDFACVLTIPDIENSLLNRL